MDKGYAIPKGRKTLAGPLDGSLIPVNADEAAGGEPGSDLIRMPAQAKSTVQVHPAGLYIQIFNALIEQHGNMLGFGRQNSSSSITAAMFSGVVSSWKMACQLSLSQSSAWLLQPTTVTALVSPAYSRRFWGMRARP